MPGIVQVSNIAFVVDDMQQASDKYTQGMTADEQENFKSNVESLTGCRQQLEDMNRIIQNKAFNKRGMLTGLVRHVAREYKLDILQSLQAELTNPNNLKLPATEYAAKINEFMQKKDVLLAFEKKGKTLETIKGIVDTVANNAEDNKNRVKLK